MEALLVLVYVLLLSSSRLTDAQFGSGSGSGAVVSAPCLDAGLTSCCPGRDDSCSGADITGKVCYCDAFCVLSASDDCCDDLMMGVLSCSKSISVGVMLY